MRCEPADHAESGETRYEAHARTGVALLLVAAVLLAWHERAAALLAALPDVPGRIATPALAWTVVLWLVVGALLECGFYGMLWTARGRRLPFLAAVWALLQLSWLDWLASWLGERAPAGAPWLVALLGAHASGATSAPFAAAFGSLGLLALARIAAWAAVQARLVRRPWREAVVIVGTTWLLTHVAQGWGLALLQGRSVLP